MFFAYRIFLFSRKYIILVTAWLASIVRLVWAIICSVYVSKAGSIAQFSNKYGWILDVLLGMHVVVDTLIAAATFTTLSQKRTKFGMSVACGNSYLDHHTNSALKEHLVLLINWCCMPWVSIASVMKKEIRTVLMTMLYRVWLDHKVLRIVYPLWKPVTDARHRYPACSLQWCWLWYVHKLTLSRRADYCTSEWLCHTNVSREVCIKLSW